jgi:Domain of unknown function (DUF4167)
MLGRSLATVRSRIVWSKIYLRYLELAREAMASGDRIAAENLYQHAEHYFRVTARRVGNPVGTRSIDDGSRNRGELTEAEASEPDGF